MTHLLKFRTLVGQIVHFAAVLSTIHHMAHGLQPLSSEFASQSDSKTKIDNNF